MKKSPGQKLGVMSSCERINGIFDPIHLIQQSNASEMLLLETADIITKLSQKSMLFFDLALRIESRNNLVTVTAVMPEAKPLVNLIAVGFKEEVVTTGPDSVVLSIKPLYHHLDLLQKMKAKSALDVLRAVLDCLDIDGNVKKKDLMIAGAFSYDFLDHFEKLPKPKQDIHNVPDYIFYLPLTLIVIDHKSKKTSIIAHALLAGAQRETAARSSQRLSRIKDMVTEAIPNFSNPIGNKLKANTGNITYSTDIPDDEFCALVSQCKKHINAGDVYQIVPSRTFSRSIKDIIVSYQWLRHLNPSPYMFYLKTLDWSLFGASPETFIKVDQGGKRIAIRPIAGTRRRGFSSDGGIDDELDSREQASLCLDEKELAEHMMLVDLARNDIASVCRPKSRRIKRLLGVDRYSHVMHLVSEVEGRMLKGFDALSAYQASMNMGTLMGAPKVRAAELLRTLEKTKRGFYGGAIGYLDLAGNLDTAIIIRSALVKDKTAYVRAGCGVVFDSEETFETKETVNKAEAILRAINDTSGP